MDEIAMSTIILHLSDNVLRKVDFIKSTAEL